MGTGNVLSHFRREEKKGTKIEPAFGHIKTKKKTPPYTKLLIINCYGKFKKKMGDYCTACIQIGLLDIYWEGWGGGNYLGK